MGSVVALLTDFGTRDWYVGAVKGAVLAVCPGATLVDITHELPRHAVEDAAFCLAAAHGTFPAGTVFVAVVDPGVGSARRGLALDAGGRRFVGPDNGLFTLVLEDHPGAQARQLTNTALFRQEVSATFHGRDVFGPVAGHLAAGLPFERVGPEVNDPVRLDFGAARPTPAGEWQATVVHVDVFGNLTTQLTRAQLGAILEPAGGDPEGIVVRVGEHALPLVRTYADVGPGEACALVGSAGRLELAVNQGHAGDALGLGRGAVVRVCPVAARRPS